MLSVKLPRELQARLAQVARQNDRATSTEAAEAIRRHVELPPPDDNPILLNDVEELFAVIREDAGAKHRTAAEKTIQALTGWLETAQKRRLRRVAGVVYGGEPLATFSQERFDQAVVDEVDRRLDTREEIREGFISRDRRRRSRAQ